MSTKDFRFDNGDPVKWDHNPTVPYIVVSRFMQNNKPRYVLETDYGGRTLIQWGAYEKDLSRRD